MNDAFAQALKIAMSAGLEHCATQVSTSPGTRKPVMIRPE